VGDFFIQKTLGDNLVTPILIGKNKYKTTLCITNKVLY
jgi:hypothetical protein